MKPGDKLFEHIDNAIMGGVAVFSLRYCQSYFCLHELALTMESGKKVIPIFCDVKPSELRVLDNKICTPSEIKRFGYAIEEAKNTMGLAFDTTKGYIIIRAWHGLRSFWASVFTSNAVYHFTSLLQTLTQQDIYATGSENRSPMLNKDNNVPWSSRLLCYAKSKPNGKIIYNFIMHSPYVRRMIPEPGDPDREVPIVETFHKQTDEELTDKEVNQMEADDQAI
nr:TMV resistance protein N-like [Tanacetum cinerariifolium]